MIEISRNSKFFKVLLFLTHMPVFALYMKQVKDCHDNVRSISSLNDICTFFRHVLYSIFFAVPLNLALIYVVGYCLYYVTIKVIVDLFTSPLSLNELPTSLLIYSYIGIFSLYVILLIAQTISNKMVEKNKSFGLIKSDGFIATTINLISEKHHSFCKRIKIKD